MDQPTATFDKRGDLAITFADDLAASSFFPLIRLHLTGILAAEAFRWDPAGRVLTIDRRSAHVVERTLLDLFPHAAITAEGQAEYKKGRAA